MKLWIQTLLQLKNTAIFLLCQENGISEEKTKVLCCVFDRLHWDYVDFDIWSRNMKVNACRDVTVVVIEVE